MSALLSNPALLVGLVRALLILLVTFGVAVTQAQQDSILELVGATASRTTCGRRSRSRSRTRSRARADPT